MKNNDELLSDILSRLDKLSYVKPENIPNIDLYMDQVTTFMDDYLSMAKRSPDDKILTKTMINNYAKNNLLPPPVKKKYSKEHILLLLFIYYYKNVLSFSDIEQLLDSITKEHFHADASIPLSEVYKEVFSLAHNQMECLRDDIVQKFDASASTFPDAPEESQEYLHLFAFISELSFDVYLKKQIIEMLIDQIREESTDSTHNSKKRK